MSTRFLLDASLSPALRALFRGATVEVTTDNGLSKKADDAAVIGLAFERAAILVTTDHRIVNKCRQFQPRNGCMFGLLILPDGIENQRRILRDFDQKKKKLRFHKIDQTLTWGKIRDYNFLVRAQTLGHPHVLELCDCRVWEGD